MGIRVTIFCRYCIGFEMMLLFLVAIIIRFTSETKTGPRPITAFHINCMNALNNKYSYIGQCALALC